MSDPVAAISGDPAPKRGAEASAPVECAVDVGRVTAWLCDVAECEPPVRVVPIGHGRSNLTFRIDDGAGRSWVLRRPPLGPRLASAHDMAREHRILSRLSEAGAPVPRPVAVCMDADITGDVFFVMEYVPGTVLRTAAVAAELDPPTRRRAGLNLMTTLASLHALDVDEIGLGDLGRRDGYAERLLRRWLRQWHGSKTRDDPRVERIARRLQSMVPPQQAVAVVHGDYRLDNVVVDERGAVRAVLDWELCTLGDPLGDLGVLLAYIARDATETTPVDDGVFLLAGFPTNEELLGAYGQASGRPLDDLPFWITLSYWKVAIILQGVYRRWTENLERGPDAAGLDQVVSSLLERADAAAA
jgi:aminoglycoside phosphotransferase (APT) family kinase protein